MFLLNIFYILWTGKAVTDTAGGTDGADLHRQRQDSSSRAPKGMRGIVIVFLSKFSSINHQVL